MRKNVLLLSFSILIGCVTLIFVVQAAISIGKYAKLSANVPASVEKWEVKAVRANEYALQATYSYEYGDEQFKGQNFLKRTFPNPWAAAKAEEMAAKNKWSIWLNPNKPEISALEKVFPKKKAISAFILIAIVGYFFFLGIYLKTGTKRS